MKLITSNQFKSTSYFITSDNILNRVQKLLAMNVSGVSQADILILFLEVFIVVTSRWTVKTKFENQKQKQPKFQSNFIEITLRHGCSPVDLLHIFRTLFSKNTSRWLLPQKHSLKNLIVDSNV